MRFALTGIASTVVVAGIVTSSLAQPIIPDGFSNLGGTWMLEFGSQSSDYGYASAEATGVTLDLSLTDWQSQAGAYLEGTAEDLSSFVFSATWSDATYMQIQYTVGSPSGIVFHVATFNGSGSQDFDLDLSAYAGEVIVFSIKAGEGWNYGSGNVNVTFGAIPAPGALALLGLAGLGAHRRRRRS
jgi:MYXO-CTERM domain-containing protein